MKPSIFKNELLATSDPLNTWIFEGLWCLADREGRLEDRPRRIHLEINPGRAYEGTETALAWLAEHGFIVRYKHGSGEFIQIVNFSKHQNPHMREPASTIPPPGVSSEQAPDNSAHIKESESETGTIVAPGQHQSGPALSPSPLPDSPSLNPLPPGEKRGARRARLPLDWYPDESLMAWTAETAPGLNVAAELDKFRDHYLANGEVRANWPASWRTWVRRVPQFANGTNGHAAPRPTRYEQLFGKEDVVVEDDDAPTGAVQ